MASRKSRLAKRIDEVLSKKDLFIENAYSKSLEELVEELKVYQYELEFQNDELKRVQEELEQSRDQFQQLFQEAPVGYVMLDAEFRTLECNQVFRDIIRSEGDCEQKPDFRKFILPVDQDNFHHYFKKLEGSKDTHGIVLRFLKPDGSMAHLNLFGRRMNRAAKRVFLITAIDITEQKKTESILKVKDDELHLISEYMTDMLIMSDLEGNIVYSTPSCRQFGFTVDKMKSMKLFDFVYPDDLLMVLDWFNKAKGNMHEDALEFRFLNNDRSFVWVESVRNVLPDIHGRITGQIFSLRNISNRKETEYKLAESERFLFDTGKLAQVGGWKLEWPSGEVYWSKVTREMHEEEEDREITLDIGLKYYPEGEHRNRIQALVKQSIERGESFDEEFEIITAKSNHKWVRILGKPVFENNVLVRLIGTFQDITELKLTREKLKESEEHYRSIYESNKDAMLLVDPVANKFAAPNRAALELFEANSVSELEGLSPVDLSPVFQENGVASADLANRKIQQSIEQKGNYFSWRHKSLKGRMFYAEVMLNPLTVMGKVMLLASLRDVSPLREAMERVTKNEERLKSLVDILQHKHGNVQEILSFSLDELIKLTESRFGYIYFYDEEKEEFTLNNWSKDVMDECAVAEPQNIYCLEKTGIWGEAVRQRRPIINNEFHLEHPLKKGYPEGHVPITKFLTIPVMLDGRIVAVAGVANKKSDYDQGDVLQMTLLMDAVWKVVERLRIENALSISEARFRTFAELSPVGIVISDHEQNTVYVSRTFTQMFGYTFEDMPSVNEWWELAYTDIEFRTKVKEAWAEALSGLKNKASDPVIMDYPVRCKDGTIKQIEFRMISSQIGYIVVFVDVTERYAILENLRQTTGYLENLINYANAPIIVWDQNLTITRFNKAFEVLTGLHSDEVIGQKLDILFAEHKKKTSLDLIQPTTTGIRLETVEIDVRCANGTEKTALWNSANILDQNGSIISTIAQGQDITERKQFEIAMQESETKYRLITENSSDVIWIFNLNQNRFTYISPSIIHLRGFTPEEAMQESLAESLTPDSFEYLTGGMNKYLPIFRETKDVISSRRLTEIRQPHKDGRIVWVEASTQFQYNSLGELEVFGVSRDITERKRLEQELRESEAQLRELNFTKDKMFSIIAHDLRSPFTSFLGLTEIMMAEDMPITLAEMRDMAGTLYKSALSTYNLLENLLEWSRLQRGMIKPEPQFVMLKQMFGKVLEVFAEQMQRKELKLLTEIPEGMLAYADEKMLETVLRNILSNAIKFSLRKGEIRIKAYKSEQNTIIVSVRDKGIGIPDNLLANLFEVDETKSRKGTEGERSTGLGLMLCKEFVELNNGHIRVESQENQGSEFFVELPRY
jgi:PAS domain S-box-containing protein